MLLYTLKLSEKKIKHNYLNNKDILKEIHRSKNTYCSYSDPDCADYDLIVQDLDSINSSTVGIARANRAERLARMAYDEAVRIGEKRKLEEFAVPLEKIKSTDVVFRVMTWNHIPVNDLATKRAQAALYITDDDENIYIEYDEDEPKVSPGAIRYMKCNFPPFQHYKVTIEYEPYCVGKSHWQGDLITGKWSRDHGTMTRTLAHMFMKLCERYATRSNWRGYCVDAETQALTQRGWLGIDEITQNDKILSYHNGAMTWSNILDIYRGNYQGPMHKMTLRGFDSLVTPEHKMVTERGLVKIEYLLEQDRLILMGTAENSVINKIHLDSFVELAGWIMTEGCYEWDNNSMIKTISLYQNPGTKADRIRDCLEKLDYKFSESLRKRTISFRLKRESAKKFVETFPEKNLNMEFICQLTKEQRILLIDTMIDGDGWRSNGQRRYVQKNFQHVELFQALCAISGIRSNRHLRHHISFGKPVEYYDINLFSQKKNYTRVSCVNFHGGKRNGRSHPGQGKATHPNQPTIDYSGQVWCPKTQYGCFLAKRNGTIYLTGNTYNDEMRSQALLQLSQIGLQFDESKSQNPFAYYTAAITNSFTRVLNIEKRNQNLRDDILEINNLTPSYTRQGMLSGGHIGDDHD